MVKISIIYIIKETDYMAHCYISPKNPENPPCACKNCPNGVSSDFLNLFHMPTVFFWKDAIV